MSEPTELEALRAWVEGRLSAEEAAALERELCADPERLAFADDFRDVWALASVGLGHAPHAELEPEQIFALEREERRELARRRWRRVAAAVALIAGGAALWVVLEWRAASGAGPVSLGAIEVASALTAGEDSEPTEITAQAAALADYRSVDQGAIRWVDSLERGMLLARATGKPMLLFGYYPGCPWCIEMRRDALAHREIVALADGYVPIGLDLTAIEPAQATSFLERGYPFLEVESPEGLIVYNFSGRWGPEEFRANLELGLEKSRGPDEPLAWPEAQALLSELARARAAELDGHLGDAWKSFGELARRGGAHALAEEGRRGAARIAHDAERALAGARAAAAANPQEALELLSRAEQRFAASPFQVDFQKVLASVERTGRFPELAGH